MVVAVLYLLLLVFGIIKYIRHVRRIDKYLKDIETLPRIPLIGNVTCFMGKSLQVLYEELYHIILRSGTPFKMQIGPSFYVILDQPEDVKTVVMSQNCLDRPYVYDFLRSPLSTLAQRCKRIN